MSALFWTIVTAFAIILLHFIVIEKRLRKIEKRMLEDRSSARKAAREQEPLDDLREERLLRVERIVGPMAPQSEQDE